MLNKSLKVFLISGSVLFIALAIGIRASLLQRILDHYVYDNRNHYLPCRKLPSESEVRAVVKAQQNLIQQIEQVNPDGSNVHVAQNAKCSEKADIVIDYPSHKNRIEIEKLIDGDTFHGVPYRLRNY